jgi:HSP20 family molecular chaperone IbpA
MAEPVTPTATIPETRGAPTLVPAADVFETKDAFIVLLEVPGADPESLDVTLERRVLAVTARWTSQIPPGYTLVHAEFSDGRYERAFELPEEIDEEHIHAVFKDGILRLTLPKASPSRSRRITVESE